MNSLETLTTFLGWCSVINMVGLAAASIMLMLMRNFIVGIHARMFDVDQEDLSLAYVIYLGHYNIDIIILTILPHVALRIMMQ